MSPAANTFLPMTAPAVLRRCTAPESSDREAAVVAKGPLIIMAHGLMAMDAAMRSEFRITSPVGEFSADDTAQLLHRWLTPRAI
ncbi:hypothetical protein LQ953_08335 [Sphingomonas sp. IC-56]|uniref:hypothetical protein n=1 Tax=Sphingomonas sp. IC-56 TaxID=2898529 RepID=UPI001E562AB0|nr:hypothetical protein [Sphingomonas sp. IC-56]MCD2324016.1 hypothetical protein [Sphingomonas sp. IC-56]